MAPGQVTHNRPGNHVTHGTEQGELRYPPAMQANRVEVEISHHIAHVRLNRPDKRNGLDVAMFEGIVAAGERLQGESGVRAVVLSGEGEVFCAGLDFQSFLAGGAEAREKLLARGPQSPANLAQRVGCIWRELPMPVIAAVHGVAFGGGLQIAAGADIRVVCPEAQLSVMEIKWGLIPDMGITATLLPSVRLDVLKELTFTGRIFSGEEAVRLGICTRALENPVAAALELATAIAQRSPDAIRAGKQMFEEAGGWTIAERLARETELQLPLLGSPNQMEAITANFQKRAPKFTDPS